MTTATTTLEHTSQAHPLIPRAGWVWIAVIAALFIFLHQVFLWRTWRIALDNSNWSHALIVPLIGIYYIHQKSDVLAAMRRRVCLWGLPIMLAGLFGYAWSIYPIRNDMASGYSMILTLFGLVLFLLGTRMMRVLWFPIWYLVLAVKISDKPWDHMAWKLQQLAAAGATLGLKFAAVFFNFSATDTGATIHLTYMKGGHLVTHSLNVAEACSGLRMLMAFIALGVALAFLWDRKWWQRIIMILSTVPIALGVNMARVTIIGVLYTYNQEMASGAFHKFIGMLMLLPAAGAFLLLGWILDRIFVEAPASGRRRQHTDTRESGSTDHHWPAFHWPDVLRGLVIGGVMGVLAGCAYILVLGVIRPDLMKDHISHWAVVVLLVLAVACIAALIIGYRWLLPRDGSALVGRASRPSPSHTGDGRDARPTRSSSPRSNSRWLKAPTARRFTVSLSVAAALLIVAAAGQSSVVAVTKTVLFKQSLQPRTPLGFLPDRMGSWQMVGRDQILPPDVVETLGTNLYLTRHYVDTSRTHDRVPKSLADASIKAGSLVRLHIAYYTGTPDTVPHVPDRCFVAGGVRPVGTSDVTLHLSGPAYETRDSQVFAASELASKQYGNPQVRIPSKAIPATLFTFAPGGGSNHKSNVVYFFVCNGKFLSGPDAVRLEGFSPWDKYGYYCKVSVLLPGVASPTDAVKRASEFLSTAMPEIMATLPDWYDVTHGLYPKK